ncbi:hypothetical protein BCV69DRAFT_45425 [Microstroma glucosiphilum]|uniref:Alpha/beta-hydrolase n=1 Tax=Pseudomicrostroma glucosiphilum TaxID=1684307 RepID=A0A316U2V0_9BASI|nr:hypothetical protein BCV69DRAFT_45425 [Pseudomicrostroma glucosiphilum]PWN19134.1 hypothetical protein BCV69DRAFT_45425 [Pseudomicrostroma glucosiphilum]
MRLTTSHTASRLASLLPAVVAIGLATRPLNAQAQDSTTTYDYVPDPARDAIVAQCSTDPARAARAALQLPYIAGNSSNGYIGTKYIEAEDADQANAYPWTSSIPFVANAAASGSADGGWQALPDLEGFTLNRTIEIRDGAIQPAYITANYNAASIKRGILVMPGKPRDSWKYTNLIRNALTVQQTLFPEWGVTSDEVIIIGPAWLNNFDQTAGAAQNNELVFHGTQWQSGGRSRSPAISDRITSYEALDAFADMLFDKNQFPNLNQVVMVGHSMGGQMLQRYSLLKKTKAYDNNLRYWLGNPGSYAWIEDARPYANASCQGGNEWAYGLNGSVTPYGRSEVRSDKAGVITRFLGRKLIYALGLMDNGAGDTHCEALLQGGNHLDRGSEFILSVETASSGTWPANHTANYVAGVSHQDYPMMSNNVSMEHIFYRDFDVRYPDLNNVDSSDDDPTEAKAKSFATPTHTIIAYCLLLGSIGATMLAFIALPFVFPVNSHWQEQEAWAKELKRAPPPAAVGGGSRI